MVEDGRENSLGGEGKKLEKERENDKEKGKRCKR